VLVDPVFAARFFDAVKRSDRIADAVYPDTPARNRPQRLIPCLTVHPHAVMSGRIAARIVVPQQSARQFGIPKEDCFGTRSACCGRRIRAARISEADTERSVS
jgi:hypothetical protein